MDQDARSWERLEELFAEAVELPRESQAVFVERETAGDPELRRQLRVLLDHDTGAGVRIAQAISGAASAAATPVDWTGRRLGPYRITREIGRGGMGLVFQAVRDDDEYRKTVALKIAPWWRDLDMLRERFRQERQILAVLEHPNIARFLDGGTEDGLPYFAMEYVEGCPITEYARRHELKLRQKIELFRQVCSAVDYAHQNLLVHRDLKPGNILVSEQGVPKLLDFGIAKLLNPFEETGGNTLTGTASWTPDYASPEQVRARPVTSRTDVYSLGLILYEMLCGERGQVADTTSPLALDHSICEVEMSRPSTRVPRALAHQLAGDLDTIVGKATHKEPERRYQSVAAFSGDLERFLEGRPVLARKDNLVYRASKFFRRNWLPLCAGALAAMVAAIGTTWIDSGDHRSGVRKEAARPIQTAVVHPSTPNPEAYKHYMTGVYWRTVPTLAHLRRAASEFSAAIAASPSYGPAQAALAEVYGRLYFTETVSAEESLAPARAAAAKALELDDGLALSHEAAALVHLIDWDWAAAEREYRRALELDPKQVRIRFTYAQLYLGPAGRYQEVIDHLRKAIELDPVDITLITELGVNYRHIGQLALAREQLRKSFELNPTALGTRTELVLIDEIEGRYAEAAQRMEAIYADGPEDAWIMGHFGYACAKAGRTTDARRILTSLKTTSSAAMHIAAVHAGLGEREQALDWLERGVAARSPSMFWLNSDFRFADLRSHPRFRALKARLPK